MNNKWSTLEEKEQDLRISFENDVFEIISMDKKWHNRGKIYI